MLLAIDTSAGTSLALVAADGSILAEAETPDTMRHAELIGEFLAELAPDPAALSGVVVGVGPGPFTGLRVGIAAARAFAWGAQLPLLPLISHDAVARAAYDAGVSGELVVSTDARRREFFETRYLGIEAGVPVRAAGPAIVAEAAGELSGSIRAAQLARVVLARQAAGLPLDSAEAVYLRSPDVTPRPVA